MRVCVRAVRLERAQSRAIGGVYIWQGEWEEREDSVREPMAPMTARMIRLFRFRNTATQRIHHWRPPPPRVRPTSTRQARRKSRESVSIAN